MFRLWSVVPECVLRFGRVRCRLQGRKIAQHLVMCFPSRPETPDFHLVPNKEFLEFIGFLVENRRFRPSVSPALSVAATRSRGRERGEKMRRFVVCLFEFSGEMGKFSL